MAARHKSTKMGGVITASPLNIQKKEGPIMEKTIVFVDIDGTVAQWLPTTTPEELVEPGYFQNLPPYTHPTRGTGI